MGACLQRSAPAAQRVASGRTVSKAALSSAACMHKADRTRRHRKELRVDVLGIDIAKAKFAVALRRDDGKVRHKTFLNTPSGFADLAVWLQRQQVAHVHACLEATGTYGEALALWLHDAGHIVSVVHPAVIHAYARVQLACSKRERI